VNLVEIELMFAVAYHNLFQLSARFVDLAFFTHPDRMDMKILHFPQGRPISSAVYVSCRYKQRLGLAMPRIVAAKDRPANLLIESVHVEELRGEVVLIQAINVASVVESERVSMPREFSPEVPK
jgi:hypothetical protein